MFANEYLVYHLDGWAPVSVISHKNHYIRSHPPNKCVLSTMTYFLQLPWSISSNSCINLCYSPRESLLKTNPASAQTSLGVNIRPANKVSGDHRHQSGCWQRRWRWSRHTGNLLLSDSIFSETSLNFLPLPETFNSYHSLRIFFLTISKSVSGYEHFIQNMGANVDFLLHKTL